MAKTTPKKKPKATKAPAKAAAPKKTPTAPPTPAPTPTEGASLYNPKALRLEAIRKTIQAAYRRSWALLPYYSHRFPPLPETPERFRMQWPEAKNGFIDLTSVLLDQTDRWIDLPSQEADDLVFPLRRAVSAQAPWYAKHVKLGIATIDTRQDAIERDREIAEVIREHPALLLMDPVVQNALGRWTYGSLHSSGTPEVQQAALALLKTARGAKTGRPSKFDGDLAALRRAYEDLKEYGNGLRKCVSSVKSAEELYVHFPDAADLNDLGIDAASAITTRNIALPTAGKVAQAVFKEEVGLSRTQLLKLMKI